MYLSAAGNASLWFGISEQYKYAMVTNFYTCGVTVQPLESITVGCRQFGIRAQRGGEATSCAHNNTNNMLVSLVYRLSRSVFSVFIQYTQKKKSTKVLATFRRRKICFVLGTALGRERAVVCIELGCTLDVIHC